MLQLSASLFDQQVISLRSGSPIATARQPIINPHNLKILGWWCQERGQPKPVILLIEDVRETVKGGLAVDSEEVLALPEDLVRHKEILELNFELIGKPVLSKHRRLVKVTEFSYNDGMFVQKLYVATPLVKVFSKESTLIIDRTQIVEVTNKHIMVKDAEVTESDAELAGAAEAATA